MRTRKWGAAATYDHNRCTRRIPGLTPTKKNGPKGTFNRYQGGIYKGVNKCDDLNDASYDNSWVDLNNHDGHWGQAKAKVNKTEKATPSDLGWTDIDSYYDDSEVAF